MTSEGAEAHFADYDDHAWINCTQLLASVEHHNMSFTDHPCLFIWNPDIDAELSRGGGFTPWWSQVIVQILYGLVCLIGLGGNTLVIYVVVRYSKMQVRLATLVFSSYCCICQFL
jgi:hypothetical protein